MQNVEISVAKGRAKALIGSAVPPASKPFKNHHRFYTLYFGTPFNPCCLMISTAQSVEGLLSAFRRQDANVEIGLAQERSLKEAIVVTTG